MPFEQGGLAFGLADCKIAEWQSAGVWGSLSDVFSAELASETLQLISDIARGDDRITGAAAVLEGVEMTVRWSGLNLTTLAIATGTSVTTISDVDQLQFVGGEHMPYIGMAVKANSEDGTDMWVWVPKCKIMSNFTPFQGEYGRFGHPEITLQAVSEEDWGLVNQITHPAGVDITVFPPANIAAI